MIELENINKSFYYNKRKRKQVLKNISLKFDKTGLVVITGESGSGKTTLLNCIGGVEDFQSGNYYINGELKSKGKTSPIEKFRRGNISFIYQNYNLIEDMTVEENIELALKANNQKCSLEKVGVVLSAVKLAKYNKRKINTLSGGQKQRVAIARALIVNPSVLLADEPTANLDKVNAIIILNILKSISNNILVILVSHQKNIVLNYADRLIEIENAQIKSDLILNNKPTKETNCSTTTKNNNTDDYSLQKINLAHINLSIYYKDNFQLDSLTILVNDDQIELCSEQINSINVKLNTEANRVTCINPCLTKKEMIEDLQDFSEIQNKLQKSRPSKTKNNALFKYAKSIINNKFSKILVLILVCASIMMAISIYAINGTSRLEYERFQLSSDKAVSLSFPEKNEIRELIDNEQIDYILPYNAPMQFKFCQKRIFQGYSSTCEVSFSLKPLPLSLISSNDLIWGRMPQDSFEIVLDKGYTEKIFYNQNEIENGVSSYGITSEKSFLGGQIENSNGISLKIVGISNTETPTFYVSHEILYALAIPGLTAIDKPIFSINSFDSDINRLEPLLDNEIYISYEKFLEQGYLIDGSNKEIIDGKEYSIKGYYPFSIATSSNAIIMSSNEMNNIIFQKLALLSNIDVIVKNKENALAYFPTINVYPIDLIEAEIEQYNKDMQGNKILLIIFSIVVITASMILYYFMIKTDINSKKKEFAITIALGMPKSKILINYILCSLLLILICALPVYLLTTYVLWIFHTMNILTSLVISIKSCLIGIILLFIMPIIVSFATTYKYIFKKTSTLFKLMEQD